MADESYQEELEMSAEALYREEVFTDRRMGSILRLTPVDGQGADDPGRQVVYVGQTQVMTPAGALPISFEISADDLADAARQFGSEAAKAVEDTVARLKEMQREAASSIVMPGSEGGGGMGGGFGGGGAGGGPGGGNIRLR